MSEIIPGSNPKPEFLPGNLPQSLSSGADLAPVAVLPSRNLWLAQLILFSLMLVSATIALLPFMFTAFYWPLALLFFLAALVYSGYECWRVKNASVKVLFIQHNVWRLRDSAGEEIVTPCDDIVLWSWVIIVPLRAERGQKFYLVVMRDSVDADAWRRLSLWLRICFKNQSD